MSNSFFKERHSVFGLRVPKMIDTMPAMRASSYFCAPNFIDQRDHCTPTEDQGATPKCAAFAVTSFAENIQWRITDAPPKFDPHLVYAKAKQLDGAPDEDGTQIDIAFNAFMQVYPDVFDPSCTPRIVRTLFGNVTDIKYTLHRYGCFVGGFNIRSGWYDCNSDTIPSGGNIEGGHAVLVCGYNPTGVIIQNSWGEDSWGEHGFSVLKWDDVVDQFLYGAVLKGCMKRLD